MTYLIMWGHACNFWKKGRNRKSAMAWFLFQSTRKTEPAAAVPLLPHSSLQWLPSPWLRSPPPLQYMTLSSKLRLSLCIIVTMRLLLSLLLYSIGDLRCLKLLLTFKKMFCSTIQVLSGPPNSIFPTNPVIFVVWNSVMPWLWGAYVFPCMRNNCLFTEPSS